MTVSSVATGYDGISLLAGNAAYDPAATFLIQRVTATGGETSLTFNSIPQTYKNLQIRGIAKDTNTGGNGAMSMNLRLNGDTGSNYALHQLAGDGSSASAQGSGSYGAPLIYTSQWRSSSGAAIYGALIMDVLDYTSSSKNKTIRYFSGADGNTGTTGSALSLGSALWMNTSAITSITLVSFISFAAGSTFALYGMVG